MDPRLAFSCLTLIPYDSLEWEAWGICKTCGWRWKKHFMKSGNYWHSSCKRNPFSEYLRLYAELDWL
jgi:hypothetical protein